MRTFLPEKYRSEREGLQASISNVKYVSLTSNIWTSRQAEGFMTVTCHYVTNDWKLTSAVLETVSLSGSHTAEHITKELGRVADQWSINAKIACIVSDNASNGIAAVTLLGWRHLPCFAYTLNLIVKEGMKSNVGAIDAQKKCKTGVSFFHHSVKATEKLKEVQVQLKFPVKNRV